MNVHAIDAVAVALCLTSCGGGPPQETASAPAVHVEEASSRRVEVQLPFVGRVEAAHSVRLVALADGRITTVAVADGARVARGAVVFEIGGPRVEARRTVLEAAVSAARLSSDAARSRLEQAQRRAASHLAGPGEVAAAEDAEAAAEESLARATADLELFERALQVAAPEAGVFVDRRFSPGQYVSAGSELGEILDPGSLRVSADVLPMAGREPAPGQKATIQGANGETGEVLVTALRPLAGAAGTVRLWLEGPALESFAPGSSVRGHVVVAVHDDAVTVPAPAVVRDADDHPSVYVGRSAPYVRRPVTAGVEGDGWIEITSGLESGEPVVTEGAYELHWAEFAEKFKMED